MIKKLFTLIANFLRSQSRPMLLVEAYGILIMICLLDHATGPDISFSIVYLVPIVITTWFVSRQHGLLVALIASLLWFGVDFFDNREYSHGLIPMWNTAVRMMFFLLIAELLGILHDMFEKEHRFATTDFLTGLANSRSFMTILMAERERATRYGHPFTLIYLDLDNFKEVNDQWGHQRGDQLLERIGLLLRTITRRNDTAARLGGDEFCILCPETDLEAAQAICNKLLHYINNLMSEEKVPVSASIGAMNFENDIPPVTDILHLVDESMYSVKNSGKNNYRIGRYPSMSDSHHTTVTE